MAKKSTVFPRAASFLLVATSLISGGSCYNAPNQRQSHRRASSSSAPDATGDRRSFLVASALSPLIAAVAGVGVASLPPPPSASAFENRIDDKYADVVPQEGVPPTNLGPRTGRPSKSSPGGSYTGLAPCPPSPNCWCSSAPFGDNAARYIGPWRGASIRDVKRVIDTYEAGRGGIDGGGYRVVEYDENGQYLYVQFQSYKAGYVDDVEFWYNPAGGAFDVRSASRVGYSDLGVNAKRLEYIGGRLEREYGWELVRRKSGSLV
eukprot:CAMPEP_0113570798 /NCGR_PEP_ID=MMETSP0015_2-20120614/25190_1 /TAXON_ID=2838 /ORGANISM="Odontella" /LENGTH=262 /DNA_ID=CAMNT_0000473661 /DNA_START=86 /DNA_END=874 /DNA_ORIENTATION=+ /assembly_acc=CAM_ASM_000160